MIIVKSFEKQLKWKEYERYFFSIYVYQPKFRILLSIFSFFFIDLTDWKTIFLNCKNNTVLFHSGLFCDYQSKGYCKFLKALEKSIFHPCEPNTAGFVKYGPDLYFVFNFHVLFIIQNLIFIFSFSRLDKFWMIHKG